MILHITNDYSGSTVYKNLVRELDFLGVEQVIYNPIRDERRVGKNEIEFTMPNSVIYYRNILNRFSDRILYKKKIMKICKDVESIVDISKVSFIHAHTWYSDGGVAYELHKKYNIPYIVAVRNSDINFFLKYQVFERSYGMEILGKAEKIITISAVYKQRLLRDTRLNKILPKLKANLMVIPNGVDDFWINNRVKAKKTNFSFREVQVLYIGKFDKGKNVVNLIKGIKLLNTESKSIKYVLTLIGGGGDVAVRVANEVEKCDYVNYVGKVYDLDVLKSYFEKTDILAMPSKGETFGLVFVEALLQGIPVLYTQNEGIDGLYDTSIGEKVIDSSSNEIVVKLKRIVENYNSYNFDITEISCIHNWSNIANIYSKLYT